MQMTLLPAHVGGIGGEAESLPVEASVEIGAAIGGPIEGGQLAAPQLTAK